MQQKLLFNDFQNDTVIGQPNITLADITNFEKQISGLIYKDNYISQEKEIELLQWIDSNKWLMDLKRRVQHYGWKYDYKARKIDQDMHLGRLPPKLLDLARQIYQDGLVEDLPDQVIINEYQSGQGIASHIDCETCFSNDIVTISLNSGCVMEFIQAKKIANKLTKKSFASPQNKVLVWLNSRSIVIMKDEARWWWFHSISPRKSDNWQGECYLRDRRVSLTFRKIVSDYS